MRWNVALSGCQPTVRRPMLWRRRAGVPVSCSSSGLHDRELADLVAGIVHLRLDFPKAEPLVRLCRIPRQWRALGLGQGCRQRKNQGLCRMVRDVRGLMMVLLVDMPIEDGHIRIGHE